MASFVVERVTSGSSKIFKKHIIDHRSSVIVIGHRSSEGEGRGRKDEEEEGGAKSKEEGHEEEE